MGHNLLIMVYSGHVKILPVTLGKAVFFPSLLLVVLTLPGKAMITVPTFNSCTKCMRISGIIHGRTTDYHPVS